jgi:tetratricopeptide (TPR) repeat protein
LEIVSECIKRYELFEEAICFRGKVYMGMNFYHKAEIDFKTVINNLSHPSFLSYVGLADCFRFQGKTDKALTYYCKALESTQEGR